jgi:hypothetical protein
MNVWRSTIKHTPQSTLDTAFCLQLNQHGISGSEMPTYRSLITHSAKCASRQTAARLFYFSTLILSELTTTANWGGKTFPKYRCLEINRAACCLWHAPVCYLIKKKTPWSKSGSELHRPSDRRLSAKWLPTFADKGATWSAWRIPTAVFSVF